MELFNEVKDCKSYWRLVRNATNGKLIAPILGIRYADRKVVTSDLDNGNILNEHFSTIGEELVNELPNTNLTQRLMFDSCFHRGALCYEHKFIV